nr:MAG TPA: hypothetical protein [Caudoviricetes sp.]
MIAFALPVLSASACDRSFLNSFPVPYSIVFRLVR